MRRTTILALFVPCALAAPASVWAAPAPDLSVAVGIVWDDMGLPYALTFDAETELGEAAWNITDGMGLVWPHAYTVDDIEWGSHLGYTHILLDGERHAVVAADDGIPVLVHVGDVEPYRGGDLSLISVHGNSDRILVLQSSFVENWETVRRQALAEHPSVPIREVPNTWATATAYHFYGVGEPPVEVAVPDRARAGFFYEGPDPTMLVVSIDGRNHAVVNIVDGPPVLAGPMEAAALGLGDITVMEPDVCVWYDGPAWADCEYAPDGPPPPLPAPTIPFKATIRTEWPETWVDIEVGGPGPYTIDMGTGDVRTFTGAPIIDPNVHCGVFSGPNCGVVGYELRDRPAKFRHDYRGGGQWQMAITGDVDWVRLGGKHLVSIDQWGDIRWKTMRNAFYGSPNLVHAAADAPDLSRVTDVSGMFRGASSVGDLSGWNVSNVEDMSGMFAYVHSFDGDLSGWDVSSVTTMADMFAGSASFNQDLSGWDASGVTDMSGMFMGAASFNQDISGWDVSSVTTMADMFAGASSFSHDISGWDISGVTDMSGMFRGASSVGDLSGWNVSNVEDMSGMFAHSSFNRDISGWDVSSVTDMRGMFAGTTSFNRDISGWDVSSVTDMARMFHGARAFNGDIAGWDTSSVTNMAWMFHSTNSFNQPIGSWNVSGVSSVGGMFEDSASFNQDISDWDLSSVTSMAGMFAQARAFNQSLNSWDVSHVTDMSGMFERTKSFNGDISEWDVSSVTTMEGMFEGSASFNRDISSWNISSVTNMYGMFEDAAAFNQPIGSWDLSGKRAHYLLIGANSFQQNLGNWYIQLDDLTVTDSDPVVGRLVTPAGWTTVGYFFLPEPEAWTSGTYSVVEPAGGPFFVDPGMPYRLPDGTLFWLSDGVTSALLVDGHRVPAVGLALMLNSTHDLTPNTTYNVTVQVDAVGLPGGIHTKQVPVFYDGLATNRPPVALAGSGMVASSGNVVTLNGTNSYDPDGDPLTYMWNQTGGPSVVLHGMDSPYPTFTAPDVQHLDTLTFELVVNDGVLDSTRHTAVVLVEPAP